MNDEYVMRWVTYFIFAAALWTPHVSAQLVELGRDPVVQTVRDLKPGEYVWAPSVAPTGPLLLIVNLGNQRALLYRNGIPIGATTVSTGRPGHSTPTGVFTVLQKQATHFSSTYDNAPMPYMLRLTWRGVAIHAGKLPGYPASHGCIRLPAGFAKLLYDVTPRGMTVIVSGDAAIPRLGVSPLTSTDLTGRQGGFVWQPELAPDGPVSIIISAADRRVTVLRNGVIIGSASMTVDGQVDQTAAYQFQAVEGKATWTRIPLSPSLSDGSGRPGQRAVFATDTNFRKLVEPILSPGTIVIVTQESLRPDTGPAHTLIETEPPESK